MSRRQLLIAVSMWALLSIEGLAKDEIELSPEEKELLERVNAERAKEQLPPLKLNAALTRAARLHTMNMARQEKLEHQLDGKSPPTASVKPATYGGGSERTSCTVRKVRERWSKPG